MHVPSRISKLLLTYYTVICRSRLLASLDWSIMYNAYAIGKSTFQSLPSARMKTKPKPWHFWQFRNLSWKKMTYCMVTYRWTIRIKCCLGRQLSCYVVLHNFVAEKLKKCHGSTSTIQTTDGNMCNYSPGMKGKKREILRIDFNFLYAWLIRYHLFKINIKVQSSL